MKKQVSVSLKALCVGLSLFSGVLTSSAVTTCPGCGKTSVEESHWSETTDFLTKTAINGEVPVKMMCFAPGTDEKVVTDLLNRIYPGWENPELYISSSRWTGSVANPPASYAQGEPLTLTYSFVPDGTTVPDDPPPVGFGNQVNNINAMLTAQFGTLAAGKAKFAQAFAQWEALTGIHYVLENNDDGASLFDSQGIVGVRGDIRISSVPMDGSSGVLAYNYFPNTGDMVLDNAESWGSSGNDYRFFRNIVTHEHGHGMGLSHVCPDNCTFLMEPFLCTAYDGPQHDDIRGGQRNYGDTNEPNDNSGTATSLGALPDGTTNVTNVSNDDNGDTDYYAITVGSGRAVTITMSPVGMTFQQCAQTSQCTCSGGSQTTTDDADLGVRLYDTNGTTLLAEASSNAAGVNEVITSYALPTAGTYYVRVYPEDATNAIQLYNLSLNVSSSSFIAITSPNGGESWNVGTTYPINWTSSGVSGNVLIELNRSYSGGTWETLIASTANDGSENWVCTGTATNGACRIRVTSISNPTISDISNANFTIVGPSIAVTTPNGGEVWNVGTAYNILWSSANLTGDVLIELNRSYSGGTWETLFVSTANDGSENWVCTGTATSATCRVRVTSVSIPSVTDVSNANFSIVGPSVTVIAPNGAESWDVGTTYPLTWSSVNISGNVMIELNRSYSGGIWETLFVATPDDGSENWLVTATGSSAACRIRVTSVNAPTATDVSDANFQINGPSITVLAPNGSENIDGWTTANVTWSSLGVSGNYRIELNRTFPSAAWEDFGSYAASGVPLAFGGPASTTARIRVTSVNSPAVGDTSDSDFTIIYIDSEPWIFHEHRGDAPVGNVTFTALVTDDHGPISCELNYRLIGAGSYTALTMPPTGNTDEFAASPALTEGAYEYYIRAFDNVNNALTDVLWFEVADCPASLAFDDGTAEGYNYSYDTDFAWAIKYEPAGFPFQLCGFEVAIARTRPESFHTYVHARILLADGALGMPGTTVWEDTTGSIGNVIGGLPPIGVQWADVVTADALGDPLLLNSAFYVVVSNPIPGAIEAFGRDDNTVSANSYYYDGCELVWHNENEALPNAQGGQRMIRVAGATIAAPDDVVIIRNGDGINLHWGDTGAPYYHIYSASAEAGPFSTFVGSTADTFYTHAGVVTVSDIKFYQVSASANP